MTRWLLGLLLGGLLLVPSVEAQGPLPCEAERAQLRWLVQKYGSERTQLEFALAASEARRQAAEAEIAKLVQALESGRAGPTNRAK